MILSLQPPQQDALFILIERKQNTIVVFVTKVGCAMVLDINVEYLMNVLRHFESNTWELIENVVHESEDDPHYSAIAANNQVVYLVELYQNLGIKKNYSDVKSFIFDHGCDDSFYETFERKQKIETAFTQYMENSAEKVFVYSEVLKNMTIPEL